MSDFISRSDSLAKYRIIHSEHLNYRLNEPILVRFDEQERASDKQDLTLLEQNFYDKRLLDSSQRFKVLFNKYNGFYMQMRRLIAADIDYQILYNYGLTDTDLITIVYYSVFYDKLQNVATTVKINYNLDGVLSKLTVKYTDLQAIETYYTKDGLPIVFKASRDSNIVTKSVQVFMQSFRFYRYTRQGQRAINLVLQPNFELLPKVIYDLRSQLIISRLAKLQNLFAGVNIPVSSVEVLPIENLISSDNNSSNTLAYVVLAKADIDNSRLYNLYRLAAINDELRQLTQFLVDNRIVQALLLRCQLNTYKAANLEYLTLSYAIYGLPELIRFGTI